MTFRQRLKEVALDHYGYVTTHDARRLGIPAIELPKLAARGGLERISQGLYRFDDIVATRFDPYAEAVLWTGADDACLAGTAVLALHELAQVNPVALRVNTSRRIRRAPRPDIVITNDPIPASDRCLYFGIASTTVAAAIRAARGEVMRSRLVEAVDTARTEGLLSAAEAEQLRAQFSAPVTQ